MDNFQKDIDDRANLTLSNRFELLLFRLGTSLDSTKSELFGINVFKLREIVPMPTFTRPAGMKPPLLGMVNIRDQVIPVIDLAAVAGCKPTTGLNILLITEYARSVQAFAVESVDNITRLDWKQVHTAEKAINGRYITSIACLDDDKDTNNLAMVLDVEQILYDIVPADHDVHGDHVPDKKFHLKPGSVAIVAEDSKVARAMLEKGLNSMEIPTDMHITGKDAWEKIQLLAQQADSEGIPVSDKIAMVLTDLEMPEMDGFTLTRLIKTDPRLKNIPVVIHSSLSGSANEDHVRKVQADGYVAKFEINELSSVIQEVLDRAANNVRGPLISHHQVASQPLLAK
ncbi:chemotaxis protein CheV [Kosakonia radicincitans]|uniref:Two-component system, chemotaxis family, response regulator CheV n=1 Tax=Kosakonia radicincitans TaxID=283686 RepID=A0AAX2EVM2_9ENTR|nr:chemotaxis protein [Kosakonia radicincitans]APG21048.1 chemotaxis protein CheV [Kosakonia radicincitans]SFF05069.1 two-component system, chemotaxis family, response regulator CheV [Kosakonia radicincitans]SFR21195.1 two-component system, chemotaxis family, response regulator CheV [Kosakonia radicincitans]SFT87811.1 two-component system, chemotaxis family, response regulator CheV [Kosakonia radicincitans]SFX76052.1 two-component system, chemotaxis family, response regulator CheV [Kosakonia r